MDEFLASTYQRVSAIIRLARSRFFDALVIFGLVVFLTGCAKGYLSLHGSTMGTYYAVNYDADTCGLDQQAFEQRLADINASMSTYIPSSEIMQINSGSAGRYALSPDLREVLDVAFDLFRISDGAFDVTIGPLIELWGFGATTSQGRPSDIQQAQAALDVGMSLIEFDDSSLKKKRSGVRLDLSAIAKGYAVDQLAMIAEDAGCSNYMVDIGGELRVAGVNPRGRAWRLGIEVPDPAKFGESESVIAVTNVAVATSGDYRNYQVFEEGRVHHVFDPRRGGPVESNIVSATVVHPSAMLADGYATMFLVLEKDQSLEIANKQGLAVYLIYRSTATESGYESVYNGAMQSYLVD